VPPDCPHDKFAYHVSLLRDAGLLEARVHRTDVGRFAPVIIFGLTWAGHEFLDAARDDTLWRRAKDKFIKPAGSWTAGILLEWLKIEIRSHVPGFERTTQ